MSDNQVSGKKASQLCASAENFDLFCHSCDENNKHVEAYGFCVECKDYLCRDCVQFHKEFRGTRNHVVQDKGSMPKDAQQVNTGPQSKDVCTEPCTKHHGKVLEYYCEPHDEFACSVCVTLEHITCGVGYLPELAKGIVESDEYKELLKQIDNLKKEYEETKETSSKSIAEIESESEAYTEKVTKLGEELIKHIRDLMKTTLDEKDKFVQKLLFDLNNSREESGKMINEINLMKLELESKHNFDIESLVLTKKFPRYIKEIKETLKKRKTDSKATIFHFKENHDLEGAKEIKKFGTLRTYKKIREQLANIDISTQGHNKSPWITGLEVLSDGKLAIVDRDNNLVKVVDTKNNHTTQLQLQHAPWDITEVSQGQLAVTISNEKSIQFLSVTDRTVKKEHLIKTNGICFGIAACQNKLIVGTCGFYVAVQILDLSGQVLRRITNGVNGEQLFLGPWHIAVNPSNNLIYVSDFRKKTLTCVTLEGEVNFIYSDKDMNDRCGLTIDNDGSVFACIDDSIQHLTMEGRKIQTLLGPGQDGAASRSIAHDKNTGNIYLGSVRKYLTIYHIE